MKILKRILLSLLIVIGIILLLFILNYARLNVSYYINKSKYIETIDVQGNTSRYVPQGLAYSKNYNIAMQTSYNSDRNVSMLYITDFETGTLLKSLELIEPDGSNNIHHVGGITTDENTVWITNDYEVEEYSLEEIITTENDYIKSIKTSSLPIRGDFCKYNNGTLWIGDFFLNPFYKVPDDNPLLLAYTTEESYNYSKPSLAISLPKMVQGMVITNDNHFVFTASFTYLIKSNLSIYDNVLNEEPGTYNLNGAEIPYYKFSEKNLIKNIKLPPMAEGMFNIGNDLYILFESSSNSYSLALPKLPKVIKFNIEN